MNRRDFHQAVAAGAGALPFAGAEPPAADAAAAAPAAIPAVAKPRKFEPVNIADVEQAARGVLPKATFDYISTGSADGWTLRENVAAFQRRSIRPFAHQRSAARQEPYALVVVRVQLQLHERRHRLPGDCEQLLGQGLFLSTVGPNRHAPALDVAIELARGELETVRRPADDEEQKLVACGGELRRRIVAGPGDL